MRDTSARMSRVVAQTGGRLAHLLGRAQSTAGGPLEQALSFLASMLEATKDVPLASAGLDPIDRLAAQLTPAEIDMVVLAAMPEEHEGYASVLRTLNPRGEPYATTGLAAQLSCASLRDRGALRSLLEHGAAVRLGIIALGGDAPFFERTLTLGEGLWPVLCGLDAYPVSLRPIAVNPASHGLDHWLASPAVVRATRALADDQPRIVMLAADSERAAMHRAVALAAAVGRTWSVFERQATATPAGDRLALAHALARGSVPIFVQARPDTPGPPAPLALEAFRGPALVCVHRGQPSGIAAGAPVLMLETPPLTTAERECMWRTAMPELAGDAGTLAARYVLEPAVAVAVAEDVRAQDEAPSLNLVADAVRARCGPPIGAGITIVHPRAQWDQLVLRPDRKALLAEALHRLRHQSTVLDGWKFLDGRPGARGVRMLLSGPPGTGKTLSAEVLAHSLGVDLMVVDISRVVSKWIGETEKHLAEAFDAAERTRAVLLFDEADALFGKRTDVSDAHDRYANLETAYLLARVERFDGVVILSTNLKQNIDPAFLRRLEFVVDFDEPAAAEREALWRCHLPPQAPLASDVNLRELAALYPVVGGLIRNASVAAGFLAAAADSPIGRDQLVGAIRREYDKSAKAFPGAPIGARPA